MTAAQLASDSELAFLDFPTEEVVIGIGTYQALVGQFERGNDLEVGGLAEVYDLTLIIKRSELHNLSVKACFQEGNRVVFRNSDNRREVMSIARVKEDDEASPVYLFLRFANARQPVNPLLAAEGNWLLSEDGKPIEA
jgi:hypothetical protein